MRQQVCGFAILYVVTYLHSGVCCGGSMSINTMSSRAFNQNVSKAKHAAANGPVFITDRGHFAHVLLTFEDYQKITHKNESIVELLAMPDSSDIDFEPTRLTQTLYRPEDFS